MCMYIVGQYLCLLVFHGDIFESVIISADILKNL